MRDTADETRQPTPGYLFKVIITPLESDKEIGERTLRHTTWESTCAVCVKLNREAAKAGAAYKYQVVEYGA